MSSNDEVTTSVMSKPSPTECIRYVAASDRGRKREENQDSFGVIETKSSKYFIVADGMGGVQGGATASKLSIAHVTKYLASKDKVTKRELTRSLEEANLEIYSKGLEESALTGMGTTFVGLYFKDTELTVINVGDSRAYRVRNGIIQQLSTDHTLVRELVLSGAISKDQISKHPVSHMLTRSVGPSPEVEVDCEEFQKSVARGDKFLLCSDGLYNLVDDDEIRKILSDEPFESVPSKCVDLANERGGTDNITVMCIEILDGYPVSIEEVFISDPDFGNEQEDEEIVVQTSEEKIEEAIEAPIEEVSHILTSDEHGDTAFKFIRDRRQKDNASRSVVLAVVGLGLLLTVFSIDSETFNYFFNDSPKTARRFITDIIASPSEASEQLENSSLIAAELPKLIPITPSSANLIDQVDSSNKNSQNNYNTSSKQDVSTVGALLRRKTELELGGNELGEKISYLNKSKSYSWPELGLIISQRDIDKKRFDELQNQLDIETRKLSTWLSRKKEVLTEDAINLANDVQLVSEEVKRKKESFEQITWEYLKAVEALKYDPNDSYKQQKVTTLVKGRADAIQNLGVSVKKAIGEQIEGVQSHLSELTAERDMLLQSIRKLDEDIRFHRTMQTKDDGAKLVLLGEYQNKLQSIESELKQLSSALG